MSLVAGYQIVDAGRVRAFQELVVVGILRNLERTHGVNELRMVLYELEELLPKASADLEFRAREDFPVFREKYNLAGLVIASTSTVRWSPSGFRAAETRIFVSMTSRSGIIWSTGHRCLNQRRFVFCARLALRVALMTSSIWLELSVFVPLRRDSSPITLSTSGSGAASRT